MRLQTFMVKRVASLVTLLFLNLFCLLQAQTYHFANYGVKEGLAQSNVSGIVQDSSGFYWIATEGGVSRFDGKNFVNFSVENGLADNNVSAIFTDSRNRLWLGHENGAFTLSDGKVFSPITSTLLPKDKKIYSFYEDKKGEYWLCTATNGAVKISDPAGTKLQVTVYSGKEGLSQYVFTTFEDKLGTQWFLTDIGIKYFDKSSSKFEFFRPEGMPVGQITSLAKDKDGNLLIGTSSGMVSRYDVSNKTFAHLFNSGIFPHTNLASGPNFIYAIYEDKAGHIWVSETNHGVYRYDKASGKVVSFNSGNGLSVNKIRSITEDNEGNMLFGTFGEGIEVFAGEKFVSHSKRNGLTDNQVWSICKDRSGSYWFGTNEGITIFNPQEFGEKAYSHLTVKEGLPANNVRVIVEDGTGNLWIGTWGGKVIKYDISQKRLVHVPALDDIVNPLVSSMMIDKRNNLWIGTVEGIVVYNLNSQYVRTLRTIDGLCDNDVSCLFEDSKGKIWIGTKQKGVTVHFGKTFKTLNRSNGLLYGSISSITEDKQNKIWIATEGGGAYVYDGKSFVNYRAKNGLASDYVTLLTVDRNNQIWLGTNKGINRFESGTKSFTTFRAGDGFTGVETKPRAVYIDDEKNIWFGTVNGVFRYNGQKELPLISPPITKILQFRVNLNEYPLSNDIQLSYKENSLSFDFIGISLSNPDGVSYKIKLEGYDEAWRVVKHTNEVYSNLPTNAYVFKLIACNSTGLCSKEITVHITITPPFWKTWWFYLIVFGVVSTGLFGYIKIRERNLIQEKKILEDKVNERTAEVVEQKNEAEKQRLIADEQKHLVQEKHKEITDSIYYAERIQKSFLATKEILHENLGEHFVLFQPKDVVSGDFYWASKLSNGNFGLATADSTGHGVPGAIMSLLNITSLETAVKYYQEPGDILNDTRKTIINRLKNDGSEHGGKDGMDCTFLSFNLNNNTITYAAANNPVWIVRNGELIELAPDKMPVGKHDFDQIPFTQHDFELKKGDCIYTLTDGLPDQFGGPKGKKFMYKRLKELLVSIAHEPMHKQGRILENAVADWRGDLEQVDDILIIGTRFVR